MDPKNFRRIFLLLTLSLATLTFLGCRTTPKADWDSRLGSYTYDQAVTELGPPDKQATLSDGSVVAEWITRRDRGGGLSIGTGVFGGHGGVSVGQTIGTGRGDRILRLVFDRENKLTSWGRNY